MNLNSLVKYYTIYYNITDLNYKKILVDYLF